MHVVLTYCETKEAASRNERVEKVLTSMGTSILVAGASTLLGVLPLSFTASEVFRTFFFTFLGLTILSSLHGLVFVPVVLSLVGPHEGLAKRKNTDPIPDASEDVFNLPHREARENGASLEQSVGSAKRFKPYEIVEL